MVPGRPRIGKLLLARGVVTEDALDLAHSHQLAHGGRLGEALIALGVCSAQQIATAIAEQLEMPFVDLNATPPEPDAIAALPKEIALSLGVIPVRMDQGRVVVAVSDPLDIHLDEALRQAMQQPLALAVAPRSQIEEFLRHYYSLNALAAGASTAHLELAASGEAMGEAEGEQMSVEHLLAAGAQASTIQVVNTLIADAVHRRASDIHIEPTGSGVRVRYRVDGQMIPVLGLHRKQLASIVARVKIICGMDIADSQRPQDGSCRLRLDGQTVELRASTLPGVLGEIVVMRILNHDPTLQRLETLGLNPQMLQGTMRVLDRRYGMLLVTGPTGSGKSTTLYAALSYLNRAGINIITVEDPVEMQVPSINQVQVNDRAGRTFSSTLRAMLRQDPDVIMVGEIRDGETADIACRAALTGHVVLSTLHTQHALGTIARINDMGVAPYISAAALSGVIAQRLVRRVCEECAEPYSLPSALRRLLEGRFSSVSGATFRKGRGCTQCRFSGTRARIGVYELLVVDETVRQLLFDQAPLFSIRNYVSEHGFRTMEEDAFEKAMLGLIPPEEVLELGLGLRIEAPSAPKRTVSSAAPGGAVAPQPEYTAPLRVEDAALPPRLSMVE